MEYQILINGNQYFSVGLYTVITVAVLTVLVLWFFIKIIWNKLREYENLKYEFITIIAHKFRTPLTQTKWMVDEMINLEENSFRKESLGNLRISNERLINLTNTLVELTESENQNLAAYNFERINLCDLVNRVAKNLSSEFHQKNLFYGVQCSKLEIFVKADSQRLEFVLQTIMENSIKYSSPGKNIDIIVATKGRKAVVQVTDYGIGIDQRELSSVFKKFYRSKGARTMDTEGFGVGLYLARSVIKRHRGKIEVNSSGLGSGSTFYTILPLVK